MRILPISIPIPHLRHQFLLKLKKKPESESNTIPYHGFCLIATKLDIESELEVYLGEKVVRLI
jgi:hypothetical protein